ncbi:MAG: hypothetical protein K9J16_03175 [Melioribacteraceae bacterium]|nr:hypothetical protein [Melioribacteraceae bacterium]MCF8353545.1 hypothetical protein [Melioribacteraceae bacterium]MCF8392521.1 hypothetical protein [Melioribacteraceae bacterium]MCF8418464.1 hypothetical protein [Melioribacteraceae bacterium]
MKNPLDYTGKFSTELKFTATYKKYKNAPTAFREAMCLNAEYPDYFSPVKDGDLFAGRIEHGLVGFSPDEWGSTAFGYYCLFDKLSDEIDNLDDTDELKTDLIEMLEFWKTESTSSKLRAAYNDEMKAHLPSDDWMHDSGIAFPLYRLTGANIDFNKLLKIGIPGLRIELERNKIIAKQDNRDFEFYDAAQIALDVFSNVCDYYIQEINEQIGNVSDSNRKNELERIINSLRIIKESKPRTYHEAIQLMWIYSLISDTRNLGRMDIYLGDFLARDIDAGIIGEDEALLYLESLWKLIADRNTRVHGRIIIGGKGRPNIKNADKFALLAMEATRRVKEVEPQLSLRLYKGISNILYDKALDVIAEGATYPILYNDDVNIQSVSKSFNFDAVESENYVPYGCGEYILEHQSFGTPSGVINLLKALEITLHNGFDPVSKSKMGLPLGEFKDFKTFEALWDAYKSQVEFYVRMMADHEKLEYEIAGKEAPFLFMSMLYDNCIERGKGMFEGGVKYLGGTLETYGNTNTADSLYAIKKMVYDDQKVTAEKLLDALDSNFANDEKLRHDLKSLPKYGNDDDSADEMLMKVHNHVGNYTRDQAERVGLDSYLVVIINNSANTLMGNSTSASADGRLAFTHMNNGNAPSGGNDVNGPTAMLNSIAKPDTSIHAGSVQNMKFSKRMFTEHRDKLKALLNTYFEKGGAQAMLTVVDRGDLENAMKHPEQYRDLIVRVGGFSARFVELEPEVQRDILNRTLY